MESVFSDAFTENILTLNKNASNFPPEKYLIVLKAARKMVCQQADVSLCQRICTTSEGSAAFSLVFTLLGALLRLPKHRQSEKILLPALQSLRLHPTLVDLLLKAIADPSCEILEKRISANAPKLPHLLQLSWDLDIEICSSVIGRVLEPIMRFDMHLSNGRHVRFEVPLEQFHKLRLAVAHLLKSMLQVENKAIMKLVA